MWRPINSRKLQASMACTNGDHELTRYPGIFRMPHLIVPLSLGRYFWRLADDTAGISKIDPLADKDDDQEPAATLDGLAQYVPRRAPELVHKA